MTANSGPSTNGFPEGYFIIRSAANKRVFDVAGDAGHDDAEVILWPNKETSLVQSRRDPSADNQVFFMDEAGVLCSKASGHAIDIEDEKLVLRRRRPITRPFPSHSHPLPKFSYSEETQEISVTFSCDPNYYDSRSIDYTTSESAWKNKIFLLVSKPKRRDPNMFDVASNFVSNTLTSSAYNLFGGRPSQQTIAAEPGALAAIGAELDEDEILDDERGEEAEVDDSPDPLRRVRMITTHRSTVDDFNLVNTARNRRRWLVETISAMDARTGSKYIP
ncbi:hypothetical protein PM082_003364 [Marasmius tenuissimus]|nr:hypothetical protein PM082_003364 [Marasmius tenuissimus]